MKKSRTMGDQSVDVIPRIVLLRAGGNPPSRDRTEGGGSRARSIASSARTSVERRVPSRSKRTAFAEKRGAGGTGTFAAAGCASEGAGGKGGGGGGMATDLMGGNELKSGERKLLGTDNPLLPSFLPSTSFFLFSRPQLPHRAKNASPSFCVVLNETVRFFWSPRYRFLEQPLLPAPQERKPD